MGIEAVGDVEKKNVILIMGGADKGIDTSPLIEEISKYCKKVVLLAGTGTDTIKAKIECEVVGSMAEAVEAGFVAGEAGDVLILSPGFASFGMYKNEYERNDEFVGLIKNLQDKAE